MVVKVVQPVKRVEPVSFRTQGDEEVAVKVAQAVKRVEPVS